MYSMYNTAQKELNTTTECSHAMVLLLTRTRVSTSLLLNTRTVHAQYMYTYMCTNTYLIVHYFGRYSTVQYIMYSTGSTDYLYAVSESCRVTSLFFTPAGRDRRPTS